jgi:anti-sigma factor RsiW
MTQTMKNERDLLRRALDGELAAEDEKRFAALLEKTPALRSEWERIQRLRALVQESRENSFGPFFSSRVMNRIRSGEKRESFTQALAWIFRRVAVAAIILIVALTAYNISTHRALGNHLSPLEAALGLPPATVSTSISNLDLSDAL